MIIDFLFEIEKKLITKSVLPYKKESIMEEKNLQCIDDGSDGHRYYYENNVYHQIRQGPTKNSYRCAHSQSIEKCPVRLTSWWNGKVEGNGRSHTHDPDNKALEKAAMKKEIREEACNTYDEPMNIMHRISRKYSKDVAAQFSGAAVSSYIYQRRQEIGRPKEPESLEQLAELLENNDEMKKMVGDNYIGAVQATDGGTGYALIFANREMLMELNSAKIIEVDGTMKAIPKKPEATQMWILSFRKHNQAFAAVHAYCRGARGELYEAILQHLIKFAPGLANVELVVSDFEGAELKAWRKVFFSARVQGCLFHLIKAITDYWKTCKLNKLHAPREAKFLARSLALLPAYLIEVGVDAIEEVATRHINTFPELRKFISYLRTQWQGKAELISTYGNNGVRTNNDSEAYNRHYTPRVGGLQVRVFPLLRNLQDVIQDECTNMARLNNGKPTSKVKKAEEQYNKDMLILEAQETLLLRIQGINEREIIRKEVYRFLKPCLPPDVQAKIDEEQSKIFFRTGEISLGDRNECEQQSIALPADNDEEYGVKRKRRPISQKRKGRHEFRMPECQRESKGVKRPNQPVPPFVCTERKINHETILKKEEQVLDRANEVSIQHDHDVSNLFEQGHGKNLAHAIEEDIELDFEILNYLASLSED